MRILYDNALLNQDVVLDMKLHESTLCDNGKIPDMSKYHNNDTITGAVWTPPYGYTLDGTDDLISVPSISLSSLAQFTVLGVFKTLVKADRSIFSEGHSTTDTQFFDINITSLGYLNLFFRDNAAAHTISIQTNIDLTGAYHYFAVTQLSTSSRQIYIDNALMVNNNSIIGTITTNQTTIGALRRITTQQYWNGIFSEILCLNTGISESTSLKYYLAAKRRLTWANLP